MVNICFSISAGIKVEYLNVFHIVKCYWHFASISRYYRSISIFLRATTNFYQKSLKFLPDRKFNHNADMMPTVRDLTFDFMKGTSKLLMFDSVLCMFGSWPSASLMPGIRRWLENLGGIKPEFRCAKFPCRGMLDNLNRLFDAEWLNLLRHLSQWIQFTRSHSSW